MGQWISEATEATFAAEVLERSKTTLVLVDFWAEWCGPCRSLTPVLEAVVAARGGAVWLVKVNVDQNQGLAAEFGIRGIPAVKAFAEGRFAGEFVGLRDQRGVETFIDRLQPSAEEQALRKAAALLAEGRFDEALTELEPVRENPQYREPALLLGAQAHVARADFEAARAALEEISPGSPLENDAAGLLSRIDLMEAAGREDEATLRQRVSARPDDVAARWALAGRLLADAKAEEALEHLLEIVQRDRAYREDGARRAMLSIFAALGSDSDLTRDYRRRLQIYV